MEFVGVIALAIGFGLGWWIKGRTIAGIESDFADAKATIERLTGRKV